MAVLSATPDARQQWREVRRLTLVGLAWLLFAAGWLTAKSLRALGTLVAAALFGVGWVAARWGWPGLCWCGRAVKLGWQEGAKPIGGQRGAA